MATLRQVCDSEPESVREFRADVPAWLVEVLARLMAKEPAGRSQTAAAIASALSAPDVMAAPLSCTPRQRGLHFAVLAGLLGLALLAVLLVWDQTRDANPVAIVPGTREAPKDRGDIKPAVPAVQDAPKHPLDRKDANPGKTVDVKPVLPPPRASYLDMDFALVPRGKSWLGGGAGKPGTREVEIPYDFYLGIYEVTQQQWTKLMQTNPSCFSPGGEGKPSLPNRFDSQQFPVEVVSWEDTQDFLKRFNHAATAEPGWHYRLPTPTEWEYACRGGPMTDKADSAYDFYFDKPSNGLSAKLAKFGMQLKRTSKVGTYPPNRLGLFDMHGNVAEWCDGDGIGSDPVNRGGNWVGQLARCRGADVSTAPPSFKNGLIGFRVARVPPGIQAVR